MQTHWDFNLCRHIGTILHVCVSKLHFYVDTQVLQIIIDTQVIYSMYVCVYPDHSRQHSSYLLKITLTNCRNVSQYAHLHWLSTKAHIILQITILQDLPINIAIYPSVVLCIRYIISHHQLLSSVQLNQHDRVSLTGRLTYIIQHHKGLHVGYLPMLTGVTQRNEWSAPTNSHKIAINPI